MVVVAVLSYMTINILYSFRLKNTPIIDIFCVASGFVIRAVAGALAVWADASPWFLLCTSLGSLWLATEKRRQELKLADSSSGSHRKVLADYTVNIVTRMENIIVPSLLTSYAIYSFNSPHGALDDDNCTDRAVRYDALSNVIRAGHQHRCAGRCILARPPDSTYRRSMAFGLRLCYIWLAYGTNTEFR